MQRMRKWVLAAAVVALAVGAVVVPNASVAQPSYVATILSVNLPPGEETRATGGSAAMQGGWHSFPNIGVHAVRWFGSPATETDINPVGYSESAALDTRSDASVGWARVAANGEYHAAVWNGNTFVDLHAGNFVSSWCNAGKGGMQVGCVFDATIGRRAAVWNGSPLTLHFLTTPTGLPQSEAWDCAEDEIVGNAWSGNGNGTIRAHLWLSNAIFPTSLHPTLPGLARDSWAMGNELGTQVGLITKFPNGSAWHAALWHGTSASFEDLHPGTLPLRNSQARDVAGGVVVGWGGTTAFHDRAFAWHGPNHTVVQLHVVLPPDCTDSQATRIDADGTITGAVKRNGTWVACMWRPTIMPQRPEQNDELAASAASVDQFMLLSASPNPFRSDTLLRFRTQNEEALRVALFDASGRHVRTLLQQSLPAGEHSLLWDGRDEGGKIVAAGTYYARAWSGERESGTSIVRLN